MKLQGEDTRLREGLADFIISFSTIEYYLTHICYYTNLALNGQRTFEEVSQNHLYKKRDYIKRFIKKNLPQLQDKWTDLNERLEKLNQERKHLVHGIPTLEIRPQQFTSYLPDRKSEDTKTFKVDDLKQLNKDINTLLEGKGGIAGGFYKEYMTHLWDWYNDNLAGRKKVIYKIKDTVVTKYKGQNSNNNK